MTNDKIVMIKADTFREMHERTSRLEGLLRFALIAADDPSDAEGWLAFWGEFEKLTREDKKRLGRY